MMRSHAPFSPTAQSIRALALAKECSNANACGNIRATMVERAVLDDQLLGHRRGAAPGMPPPSLSNALFSRAAGMMLTGDNPMFCAEPRLGSLALSPRPRVRGGCASKPWAVPGDPRFAASSSSHKRKRERSSQSGGDEAVRRPRRHLLSANTCRRESGSPPPGQKRRHGCRRCKCAIMHRRWGGETTLLTELALGLIREGRFLGSPFSH